MGWGVLADSDVWFDCLIMFCMVLLRLLLRLDVVGLLFCLRAFAFDLVLVTRLDFMFA